MDIKSDVIDISLRRLAGQRLNEIPVEKAAMHLGSLMDILLIETDEKLWEPGYFSKFRSLTSLNRGENDEFPNGTVVQFQSLEKEGVEGSGGSKVGQFIFTESSKNMNIVTKLKVTANLTDEGHLNAKFEPDTSGAHGIGIGLLEYATFYTTSLMAANPQE